MNEIWFFEHETLTNGLTKHRRMDEQIESGVHLRNISAAAAAAAAANESARE